MSKTLAVEQGISIALDVTSYLASRTGVGVCVGALASALLVMPGNDKVKLCAVSIRREARARLRQSFPGVDTLIRLRKFPLRLLSPLADAGTLLKVESLFGEADVFHAGPALVPPAKNAAVVVTVWDLTPIRFPETHLSSNVFTIGQLRRRLRHADLVIVPSSSTARDIEELQIIQPDRVRVVPLAADQRFRPADSGSRMLPAGLKLEGEYLLNVGALEPRKNLPRLFRAFRLLKDRHRIPHKLVVAGPRGWKDEEIYQSVRDLRLSEEVLFTGFVSVDDLRRLYNHAALLVYPSLYEGFGLPPLEAMASGCPVAVSRSSSLPEVVGEAGVYFDPLDVEDMAQAVFRVLDSTDFRRNLIESGKAQSSQFSWEKTAVATRHVYREAVALRRGKKERHGFH